MGYRPGFQAVSFLALVGPRIDFEKQLYLLKLELLQDKLAFKLEGMPPMPLLEMMKLAMPLL
jgi:hypothetical protein